MEIIPLQNFREIIAVGNGHKDAHVHDIVIDIYHNGRERLFIIRLGPRKTLK